MLEELKNVEHQDAIEDTPFVEVDHLIHSQAPVQTTLNYLSSHSQNPSMSMCSKQHQTRGSS